MTKSSPTKSSSSNTELYVSKLSPEEQMQRKLEGLCAWRDYCAVPEDTQWEQHVEGCPAWEMGYAEWLKRVQRYSPRGH